MSTATRFALAILGTSAVLLGSAGTAAADTPPGCTAADLTNMEIGVAAAMTGYLFSHPDVNAFLTGLQGLSPDEAFTQSRDYFTANPDVKDALKAIRSPAKDFRNRCGIPVDAIIRGVL